MGDPRACIQIPSSLRPYLIGLTWMYYAVQPGVTTQQPLKHQNLCARAATKSKTNMRHAQVSKDTPQKKEMKSFHMHIYRKKKRKQFEIRTQVCNRPSPISSSPASQYHSRLSTDSSSTKLSSFSDLASLFFIFVFIAFSPSPSNIEGKQNCKHLSSAPQTPIIMLLS